MRLADTARVVEATPSKLGLSGNLENPMARRAMIILRVHEDEKSRLEKAAGESGLTLTSFLLKAAERQAKEVDRKSARRTTSLKRATHHGSGALPTFFRATCMEAQRGGDRGYDWAGYTLFGAAAGLIEWRSHKKLQETFEELKDAIEQGDDAAVLEWFDRELPRCMALIPKRRRGTFLRGVYEAEEQTGVVF
jgi:hypothetical protein